MTDKLFDDFIKDKIQSYASKVPAGMWESIQKKKDKKRGAFWWRTFAFVSMFLCIAFLFGWFAGNERKLKATEINTSVEDAKSNRSIAQNPSGNEEVLASEKTAEANTSLSVGDNSVITTARDTDSNGAKDGVQQIDNITKGSEESTIKAFKASVKAGTETKVLSKDKTGHVDKTEAFGDGREGLEVDSRNNKPDLFFRDRLPLLVAKEQKVFESNPALATLNKLKYVPYSLVDCPSDKHGERPFYVEFFVSPDIASKKIEYKGRGMETYQKRKDSTESAQLSYTVGVRLTKALGDHLMFKTGLQYSQINEKFNYRNTSERNQTTVVTIRTIVNAQGDTLVVRDTSVFEQVGFRAKTTYNRYRSFDIPLLFGYEFGGETWKVGVNAGAILNLSSWQEGEFLDTSYLPSGFTKGKEQIFKRKVGMGLYGGLSFIKSVGRRTEFFAEPYMRINLSNLTTDASPFKQKFNVAGMLLGIRYKLSGKEATK
jgi:hypothetical protein